MKIEIKNIIATFQRVIRACNGTTAQNVPQQMLYIVGICGSMAYEVNKQYGKGMPYCNLMNIIQLASETTTGNFAHKVATGCTALTTIYFISTKRKPSSGSAFPILVRAPEK